MCQLNLFPFGLHYTRCLYRGATSAVVELSLKCPLGRKDDDLFDRSGGKEGDSYGEL